MLSQSRCLPSVASQGKALEAPSVDMFCSGEEGA